MSDSFKDLNANLKKQDKQIAEINKATTLEKEGKIDEAIGILERIMYKEGLLINGVKWPFILSEIYIKNKMYDKCWKYLSFIYTEFPTHHGKIREIQAKILKAEKKYLDALVMKMVSLLIKYTSVEFKLSQDKVEQELNVYIKNAKLLDKKNDLLALYNKHITFKKFNESLFRDEFKNIVQNDKLRIYFS